LRTEYMPPIRRVRFGVESAEKALPPPAPTAFQTATPFRGSACADNPTDHFAPVWTQWNFGASSRLARGFLTGNIAKRQGPECGNRCSQAKQLHLVQARTAGGSACHGLPWGGDRHEFLSRTTGQTRVSDGLSPRNTGRGHNGAVSMTPLCQFRESQRGVQLFRGDVVYPARGFIACVSLRDDRGQAV